MSEHDFVRLSDLTRDQSDNTSADGVYDPTGDIAYGSNGEKIGTVRDALVEYDTGLIRYFLVDANAKQVLIPVGNARLDDQGVYFDQLTNEQVGHMRSYSFEEGYGPEAQEADERVLRGAHTTETTGERVLHAAQPGAQGTPPVIQDEAQTSYRQQAQRTPDRLRLLEERLVVNKDRFVAGSVEISKHVETRQEQVNVALQREEIVIERHPVTEVRAAAEGTVLGAASETIQVDLEAERANVGKEAYVTEEIGVGKRTVTDNQTVTETVGREVLDVTKTGEVRLEGHQTAATDPKTTR
ncbi:DUF2382 domain-containing protein [Deinococcus psychrotolerans]|uniref:DUF2382 domain-containing protein n=1 Tax=Deinococcus psychrotolerans TaxID=2489213 RepID=A0A3G8YIQ3_9DEIO|nr:DUF2382 domain-containing protein [Deinococcus psychrotolerans]AZI44147.1 DUF2382 domain-containing protein [Deinococcus psychrotolerans]